MAVFTLKILMSVVVVLPLESLTQTDPRGLFIADNGARIRNVLLNNLERVIDYLG